MRSTLFELGEGGLHLLERVGGGDRDVDALGRGEVGEFSEYIGARGIGASVGAGTKSLRGLAGDDCLNAGRRNTRSTASCTYSGPNRSMNVSTPVGATSRIRSRTPGPWATGTAPWAASHGWFRGDRDHNGPQHLDQPDDDAAAPPAADTTIVSPG